MSSHRVPVFTQSTISLCWEACARMMWAWRHNGLEGYTQRAGTFLGNTGGLSPTQMDAFYRQLGMRSQSGGGASALKHALTFSPVAFYLASKGLGHALVASGDKGQSILINNPCLVEAIDFETDSATCEAGRVSMPLRKLQADLGRTIWFW